MNMVQLQVHKIPYVGRGNTFLPTRAQRSFLNKQFQLHKMAKTQNETPLKPNLKHKLSLRDIHALQSNQAVDCKGLFQAQRMLQWVDGKWRLDSCHPSSHPTNPFDDTALYTVEGSANSHPPTSTTNQRGEASSLFRTISQWAGCPKPLLTAHLVPVR